MGCEMARWPETTSAEGRCGKLVRQSRTSIPLQNGAKHYATSKRGFKYSRRAAEKADLLAKCGTKTPLEMLQTIALHNSYHLSQIVMLRQRLCAWPPPSGGLTW